MADVARDRAQLVLVAALVLAATFIGLALVVNTVIVTENMATRKSVDAGAAMTYRQSAGTGGANALHVVNYGSDDASYADRSGNFTAYVSGWSNATTRYSAVGARSGRVEVLDWSKGTRISQDDPDDFRPADWNTFVSASATDVLDLNAQVTTGSPHEDWPVANEANVRDFRMTVEETSLESTNETVVGEILDQDVDQSAFWVQIDDGTDTWKVAVYDDNESGRVGNVSVIVDDGSGKSDPADCTAASRGDGTVDIDLTGGTITGADGTVECEPLSFFEDTEDYDVYYVNGDEVNGTYGFISDQETSVYENRINTLLSALGVGVSFDDSYYDDPSNGDPFFTTAIYDVELRMTHRSDELTYRTQVRLAPGEPEEGRS